MTGNQTGPGHSAPWYLWAVGGVAILWNGFGTLLWAGTSFMPDTFLDGLPATHRDYVSALPVWATLTWGLGVLGGVAGSILLLMRNRLAVPVFVLSLLAAAANTLVYFTNPPPDGFFNVPLQLFINGFAIYLIWFAHSMKRRGVLG